MVPIKNLLRAFETANVKRPLVEQLCQEASGGQLKDPVAVGDLVRFVCKSPNKFNFKTFLALFASKVKVPVRESLQQCLAGHNDDGVITKDEFINSFAQFEDSQMTKWSMACLFY